MKESLPGQGQSIALLLAFLLHVVFHVLKERCTNLMSLDSEWEEECLLCVDWVVGKEIVLVQRKKLVWEEGTRWLLLLER